MNFNSVAFLPTFNSTSAPLIRGRLRVTCPTEHMNSLILPPYLHEGDKVAIVSPSSKIDKSFLKGAKKRLESWGLKVIMGKHAGSASGRYAGTVKQRLSDLQSMMNDPEIKAIFCSRGGYGKYFIDEVMGGATDDHLFINEIAGIKTIDIIPCDPEGEYSFDPTWHTIKDDMDNIDRNTLKAVGQTVMGVIYNEK
jgi:hypothetical protein